MIDHITLRVKNIEKSLVFYELALRPLGYSCFSKKNSESEYVFAGFGTEDKVGKRDLWLRKDSGSGTASSFSCLAFTAGSKQMVDDFYDAAIMAGGKDNGAPGYRPKYHPGYYAAFVLDPDGNNIEAVFDDPLMS